MRFTRTHLVLACSILPWVIPQTAWAQEAPPREVGERPPQEEAQPDVAAVFQERGLLTPKGGWVVEPSLQYVHSSSTTVAIDGFTILPAIAIGLIDLTEVQRDTLTAALSFRYGLSNRMEVGIRIPYVWRDESLRRREILVGTPAEQVTGSDGQGLGDVELALHYQFNRAVTGKPFFIGNLRVKAPTGDSPFDVERELIEDDDGRPITEIFVEQPTGSGFWAVQPSLTMTYPTDPAVIYGNLSYLWNIERDVGDGIGRIDPGDALGISVGAGIALNNQTSISLGYDHSMVFKTKYDNAPPLDPSFDRIQVGTFLWGLSHRFSPRTSMNLSVGIGATSAAPDTQVTLRIPMRF
ncbi:transporter [Ectothiorhodospira marina]|uniref:Putative MetA-pathway of phenol degradation n=1 Tax=Ectothiorhodospira marina TaxID=1396821 RepID=A0A1H7GZL7_9GAMM|nr:transporter [Ectothiorhodospira marina]SEK43593.1 Putative MetA-pathway of phenol degradation [Ectothiorhodospira marina]